MTWQLGKRSISAAAAVRGLQSISSTRQRRARWADSFAFEPIDLCKLPRAIPGHIDGIFVANSSDRSRKSDQLAAFGQQVPGDDHYSAADCAQVVSRALAIRESSPESPIEHDAESQTELNAGFNVRLDLRNESALGAPQRAPLVGQNNCSPRRQSIVSIERIAVGGSELH